jgi:hypothetical protein
MSTESIPDAVDDGPADWVVCRECEQPVSLLQGFTTAWYHEYDDSLVCGGRVWKRVPIRSISRLWSPVRYASQTAEPARRLPH